MAQWVLVFTPPEIQVADISRVLSDKGVGRVLLSADSQTVDAQQEPERVEVTQDNALIYEYDADELAAILAAVPRPNAFRISYYRGAMLLSDVLRAILELSNRVVIDNDYGVIMSLDLALVEGLSNFLASRGGRFSHQRRISTRR